MIHKNCKIDNTPNSVMIELGDGDLGICVVSNSTLVGIGFSSVDAVPIGTNIVGSDAPIEAAITFKNLESLEVFEKKLSKVKDLLKQIKSE
jgi:hypothetical protein